MSSKTPPAFHKGRNAREKEYEKSNPALEIIAEQMESVGIPEATQNLVRMLMVIGVACSEVAEQLSESAFGLINVGESIEEMAEKLKGKG